MVLVYFPATNPALSLLDPTSDGKPDLSFHVISHLHTVKTSLRLAFSEENGEQPGPLAGLASAATFSGALARHPQASVSSCSSLQFLAQRTLCSGGSCSGIAASAHILREQRNYPLTLPTRVSAKALVGWVPS